MDVNQALMRGARKAAPVAGKRRRARISPGDSRDLLSLRSPPAKARRSAALSSPGASSGKSQALSGLKQEEKAPQQTYIDVGQRSFGARATCRACGLLFTVGEEVSGWLCVCMEV